MNELNTNSWRASLPSNWLGDDSEECFTIYDPNGVGALQISSYLKSSQITNSDLCELAEDHIEAGAQPKEIQCGEFIGFTFSFGTDEEFWQLWYVASGKVALFISYNCEPNGRGAESDHICQILNSLKTT